jgi:hypothetical protein
MTEYTNPIEKWIDLNERARRHGQPTAHLRFTDGKLEQLYLLRENVPGGQADYKAWIVVEGQEP